MENRMIHIWRETGERYIWLHNQCIIRKKRINNMPTQQQNERVRKTIMEKVWDEVKKINWQEINRQTNENFQSTYSKKFKRIY